MARLRRSAWPRPPLAGGWLALCPDAPRSVWDAPVPLLLLAQVAFGENAGSEYDAGEEGLAS